MLYENQVLIPLGMLLPFLVSEGVILYKAMVVGIISWLSKPNIFWNFLYVLFSLLAGISHNSEIQLRAFFLLARRTHNENWVQGENEMAIYCSSFYISTLIIFLSSLFSSLSLLTPSHVISDFLGASFSSQYALLGKAHHWHMCVSCLHD